MSKVFLAFNLMFVILPSILCAGIDPKHKAILKKHTKNFHGSNFKIHQLESVDPSFCAAVFAKPYMIYGVDKDSKEAYLELWSISGDDRTLHWGFPTFDKRMVRDDENLTVALPVPNAFIRHGTRNKSGQAQGYNMKFIDGADYKSFVDFCTR